MSTRNKFKKGFVKFKDLYEYVKSYVAKYLELQYKGAWNASTNTPTLTDGVGNNGDFYRVSVAGTQNLGSGSIEFTLGDEVRYNETLGIWQKFDTGVSYVPVNKAGDTMTGNLSAPKVAIGTTNFPAIDTIGEGLTTGASLDGVTQTTRTSRSRIGNAELNFVVNHLHSDSNWIKNLFCRSNGNTSTHASVTNGQLIAGNYYAGRFQSAGSGSYYLAAQDEYGIDDTGTISASSMPGKIVRSITPNGSKTPVAYETVSNNGNVAFSKTMQYLQRVNKQTGTSYILAATDYATLITFNNPSAITVILPQQLTLTTTDGFWCKARNLGAGTITFVKEGSETIDGNTTLIQYGEVLIQRPTTTKWSIAYGTAVVNMPGMGTINLSITTSQTKDLWCPQAPCTLLGIRFRAFSVGTAGTFKLQLNGVDIPGLTGLVPSTTQTIASVSSSVALANGDVITIVADGTLVTIADLNITPSITVTY
jgi:hypothetical protein